MLLLLSFILNCRMASIFSQYAAFESKGLASKDCLYRSLLGLVGAGISGSPF